MCTPGISTADVRLPVVFAGNAPSARPVSRNVRVAHNTDKVDIYAITVPSTGKPLASWGKKLEKVLFFLAALPLLLFALLKTLIAVVIPVLKDSFKWQALLKQAYPRQRNRALVLFLSHLVLARLVEKTGIKPSPDTPLPTASHYYYGNIIRNFPRLLLWKKSLPLNLADKVIETTPENEREALWQAMTDYRKALRERYAKTPPNDQSRQALEQKLQKAFAHLNGLLP